eukprot:CCRYP_019751-RA/>CCRYP_019751-RA protein AED:0.03 eAED:0.03 QI:217/1/1/1/1/1/2/180/274
MCFLPSSDLFRHHLSLQPQPTSQFLKDQSIKPLSSSQQITMTSAHSLLTGSTPLKLEYFNIEGVAEPVRLALSVASIPFDDVRIPFDQWPSKKPSTKHGVLPEMTLPGGEIITDSMAMLRLVGEADEEGKLYPSDVAKRVKIEQVLGLVGDLTRAWSPSLYLSMRPGRFGYPADWSGEEKDKVVKAVREAFMSEDFPRFMGYFEELVKENGDGFLTGEDLTIADLSAFQQISYFTKGIAEHVPKDCLDSFVGVKGWLERVASHPKIAAYKASKE